MTQADYGVALTLFLIMLAFTVFERFGPLRRERLKVCRYKLFAVRDEVVRLVAEGKIAEEDDVFQFLYHSLNDLIPHTKPLTLAGLVQGFNVTELGKITDADASVHRQIMRAMNHPVPEVKSATRLMLKTFMQILFDRSYFVWLSAVTAHLSWRFFARVRSAIKDVFDNKFEPFPLGLFKTQREALRFHRAVKAVLNPSGDRTALKVAGAR